MIERDPDLNNIVLAFLDAIEAAGIRPIEPLTNRLGDGKIVRFRAEGDKPGRRNGWAVLHLDGKPAGAFGHYRLGVSARWRSGEVKLMPFRDWKIWTARLREADARRKIALAEQYHKSASACRHLWDRAGRADPAHPYLIDKSLCALGIRQSGKTLLVPMVDRDFRLRNLQRIFPDGAKRFQKGGRTHGLFWPHALCTADGSNSPGPIVIGEGYATMAAVYLATGHSVASAMSASNLFAVARIIRERFPNHDLIVAADDDCHLPTNTGLEAARKAAESVGGRLATPRPLNASTRSKADFADLTHDAIRQRFQAAFSGEEDNG